MARKEILHVKDLTVWFYVRHGISKILNGLDLSVKEGELLGLVGESGSGKTVLATALLGRVHEPGRIEDGKVFYREKDLLTLTEDELMRKYRGKEIGLIAANARAHLNPLLRVGDLIADVYMAHTKGSSKTEAHRKAVGILRSVGINDAEKRVKSYPHELSGGMAQRVMIALSLVNAPNLLIADDCTNGLDVTVAAQVMDLFLEIMAARSSSGILITHDLGIVAQCCSEIAIMYCGTIVEKAPVKAFFESPTHPYSITLLNALPEKRITRQRGDSIGNLPNPLELPDGCLFHPRCAYATNLCREEDSGLHKVKGEHFVKCHYPGCALDDSPFREHSTEYATNLQ